MKIDRHLLGAKTKALLAHLAISALLVGLAFVLILKYWFPEPFFVTDGADEGIRLIVLVDMVLGPLLTFVVFNPVKTRRLLAVDLGLIAAAQLFAYGAGLWSIHSVRIQAVAFYEGKFNTANARTFDSQTISPADWSALGADEPHIVTVREPINGDESAGVLAFGMTGGLSAWQLQFLYVRFASRFNTLATQGYSYNELASAAPKLAVKAGEWAKAEGQSAQTLRYFPVEGVASSAVMAFTPKAQWLGGFAGKLAPKPPLGGSEPEPSNEGERSKSRRVRRFVPQAATEPAKPARAVKPSSG